MKRLLPWFGENLSKMLAGVSTGFLAPSLIQSAVASILIACLGCQPIPQPSPVETTSVKEMGSKFDPDQTGTLKGTVLWNGPLPDVQPLIVNVPGLPTRTERNPNHPRIDAVSRGIAGTVVYLTNVDLNRSRRWDYPPVRVAAENGRFRVLQGPGETSLGLVQQGDTIEWMNHDSTFLSLRARGAAFFSLPFVHSKPAFKRIDGAGPVEISSGSGQFWMRAHLFASPHPYVCLTDTAGRFELFQVPAGSYELHCWLPNWEVSRLEYDPEQRHAVRLNFAEAWHSTRNVEMTASGTTTISFSLGDPKTPSK